MIEQSCNKEIVSTLIPAGVLPAARSRKEGVAEI